MVEETPLRATGGRPRSGRTPSEETLDRLYRLEKKSIREIALVLGCTKDLVARALKRGGIKARERVRHSSLEKLDIDELKRGVKEKGIRGTARELGINASTLSRFLRKK